MTTWSDPQRCPQCGYTNGGGYICPMCIQTKSILDNQKKISDLQLRASQEAERRAEHNRSVEANRSRYNREIEAEQQLKAGALEMSLEDASEYNDAIQKLITNTTRPTPLTIPDTNKFEDTSTPAKLVFLGLIVVIGALTIKSYLGY